MGNDRVNKGKGTVNFFTLASSWRFAQSRRRQSEAEWLVAQTVGYSNVYQNRVIEVRQTGVEKMEDIDFIPIFFVVTTVLLYICSVPLVYRYWKQISDDAPECYKKKK